MNQVNKPTMVRFLILALLTIGTAINYLDRSIISVAAPHLSSELHLNPAIMGIVFSAFSWTYAASQIPGGIILDKVGVRLVYGFSVTLWSAFTVLQGFSGGLFQLLLFRLGLGVAEAPAYPCNSRVLSIWFPQSERARATGVYSVGQYVGLALFSPVLFWMAENLGWRQMFYIIGAIGIVFGIFWMFTFREPSESKLVNKQELDLIEAGGGLGDTEKKEPFSWDNFRFLLTQRGVVGAALGQFAGNSTLVFFLTWFPTYLATERHMAWIKAGFFATLPYLAASVGVVVGGIVSDLLLKKTGSATFARKAPIIAGLLLASTIVAANFLNNNVAVIAVMCVAFFGQGIVNLGWTLITDIAPKPLIGLTGGIFNLCANLAGIITPLVIGFIVNSTGSFVYALAYIAIIAIVGVLSYVFILGDVKRVEMPVKK